MKLLFPSSFFALALIQSLTTSNAFTPTHHSVRQLHRTAAAKSTQLQMVGFQDPRKTENASAMKSLQRLDQETKKVKKWLAYLMDPQDEDADTEEASPSEQPAVDDIGLLGGMTTVSSPTVNLPSYKPSLRTDLGNTILLTGTYHPGLLRALNNNDFGNRSDGGGGESGDLIPNFQFEKIILSIQGEDMAKEAKKRVISREARYSGLLNKVVIEAEENYLPNVQRMEGVSSWIVRLDAGETAEMLPKVAELAKSAETLKNVIVIVEGMASMACDNIDGWDVLLAEDSFQSTLFAVGELYDEGDAGKFYHIGNYQAGPSSAIELTNDDAKSPKMLRGDAYFTLANLLALNVSANKALVAYEYSPTTMETVRSSIEEAKKVIKEGETEPTDAPDDDVWKGVKYTNRLVRAMREMGFSRLGELDVLLARGVDVSCSSPCYAHLLCNHISHYILTRCTISIDDKGIHRISKCLAKAS